MNEYQVYLMYIGIKLHFSNNKYDFIKSKGNVKATTISYEKRKDKLVFKRLAKKYNRRTLLKYFISNFLKNSDMWAGELIFNDNTSKVMVDWIGRIESLSYNYSSDLDNIFLSLKENNLKFSSMFDCKNGDHPPLFRYLQKDMIDIESFVILNSILNFYSQFSNNITEDYIWPTWRGKCERYLPFLRFDAKKMIKITQDRLKFYDLK